jgi:glutamate synthase (NADPH/NADH) large chain
VVWQRVESAHWEEVLKALVQEHAQETQSRYAARLLNDWDIEVEKFWQIAPKEMLSRLAHPLRDAKAAAAAAPAE